MINPEPQNGPSSASEPNLPPSPLHSAEGSVAAFLDTQDWISFLCSQGFQGCNICMEFGCCDNLHPENPIRR